MLRIDEQRNSIGSPMRKLAQPRLLLTLVSASLLYSAVLFSGGSTRLLANYIFSQNNALAANSEMSLSAAKESTGLGGEKMDIPVGLRWIREAHDNPWSFSVMRTGIAELTQTVENALAENKRLPRVVISFTSLPKRFTKHVHPMISLLKQQSFRPDTIYVCVPKTSRRSNDTFILPQWLLDDPLVTVLRPTIDMGPATKLIPALEAELRLGNKDTRVVTVDDDNEGGWNKESLLALVAYSLHFPDAAIGLTGWNATCMVSDAHCSIEDTALPPRQFTDRAFNFVRASDDYACHSLADWLPEYYPECSGAVRKNHAAFVDVLEGYKGVVYQPRFFNMKNITSLMDKLQTPEFFFLCDDVWFSGWLGVANVPRLVVNPAIHDDASIRLLLKNNSDSRHTSPEIHNLSETELKELEATERDGVEGGLHSAEKNFVAANHMAVQWFEKKQAWTPNMWKAPTGWVWNSTRLDRAHAFSQV